MLFNVCPNCGGGFVPRPHRPKQNIKNNSSLLKYPASTKVVYKPVNADAHRAFSKHIKNIPPAQR
ncbi:MAG: DUF1272 domain-containing protein [Gammaproteobacteria bacterium]|nr:DUF1272 domain-containing protein [Gammaproteobacteria bacterium]